MTQKSIEVWQVWLYNECYKVNLSDPFGAFSVLRHPNHLLLARMNNRNVIITQRFHAAPVQASRDFLLVHDWLHISTVSTFPYICRVNFFIWGTGFYFSFVSGYGNVCYRSWNKGKIKITWDKKLTTYTRELLLWCLLGIPSWAKIRRGGWTTHYEVYQNQLNRLTRVEKIASLQITAHIFWRFPNGKERTIWFSNLNFRFSNVNASTLRLRSPGLPLLL